MLDSRPRSVSPSAVVSANTKLSDPAPSVGLFNTIHLPMKPAIIYENATLSTSSTLTTLADFSDQERWYSDSIAHKVEVGCDKNISITIVGKCGATTISETVEISISVSGYKKTNNFFSEITKIICNTQFTPPTQLANLSVKRAVDSKTRIFPVTLGVPQGSGSMVFHIPNTPLGQTDFNFVIWSTIKDLSGTTDFFKMDDKALRRVVAMLPVPDTIYSGITTNPLSGYVVGIEPTSTFTTTIDLLDVHFFQPMG